MATFDQDDKASEIRKAQLLKECKDLTSHPRWAEYVAEAEHQDGLAYWLLFDTADRLRTDFKLYCQILEETD